jgi:hypothetical protein
LRLRSETEPRLTRAAIDDRQPRLVLRFAVVTALGLALAGALILAVVREIDQRHAVREATNRTHFVAETFLRGLLRPADAAGPVQGKRRAELDRLMKRYVLIDGALRVSLVGPGDRVTYSTDHRLIGSAARDAGVLADVRGGSIVSRVSSVPAVDGSRTLKALLSSVPVAVAKHTIVVVSIEQDYAPISAAARESLLPVAGVLELALVLLFVLLLPVLARASRRLRRYVEEIRYQARHDSLTGLSNREALQESVVAELHNLRDG